jgi:hypothetical protein
LDSVFAAVSDLIYRGQLYEATAMEGWRSEADVVECTFVLGS